jgi:hypothetical protein
MKLSFSVLGGRGNVDEAGGFVSWQQILYIRETNRMIFPLGHDTMKVGQQDALAAVEVLRLVCGAPSTGIAFACSGTFPVYSAIAPVKLTFADSNASKVCDSVVRPVAVDVVNYRWLLSVMEKPAKSMCKIVCALIPDSKVAVRLKATSDGPSLDRPSGNCPSQIARIGVVIKDIADRIRYKFHSHLKLPLHLVRGAVVDATVTPILSRGSA